MNKLFNYIKCYIFFFIILFIFLLIFSIINYYQLIPYNILSIICYIFILILFFILGIKISILEQNRGYLNGFLISLVLIIAFMIITLIFDKISFSKLVYYLSLIATSITGGIIGIQKKNK